MTRYIVINENTLAHTIENNYMVGVLAGSVRDGGYNPLNGPIFVSPFDAVRDATEEDFAHFRVQFSDHYRKELDTGKAEVVKTWADIPPAADPLTKEDYFCICKTDPGFPCPHCDYQD